MTSQADHGHAEHQPRRRNEIALCASPPTVQAGMTDAGRLHEMIDELRQMLEQCEPKSNQNSRYLRYSNAVSA